MHKKIVTVYDSKAQAYLNPMVFRSTGDAIRAFGDLCSNSEHDFHRHAEDYTLFEIGEWDEFTGSSIMYHAAIPLSKAIEASPQHKAHYFTASDIKRASNE